LTWQRRQQNILRCAASKTLASIPIG